MNQYEKIEELISLKPELMRRVFQAFHRSEDSLPDEEIDRLLGIDCRLEKQIDGKKLKEEWGIEQFFYEGTSYNYARQFLREIKPKESEIIYDLGSGHGRVVFYGALATPATYKGVEIVPERVDRSLAIRNRFGIENCHFIHSNILDVDYSDGDIFFLFNPFYRETLEKVGDRLRMIAEKKPIRIITWGGSSNDFFMEQDWLTEIRNSDRNFYKLQYFTNIA